MEEAPPRRKKKNNRRDTGMDKERNREMVRGTSGQNTEEENKVILTPSEVVALRREIKNPPKP